MEIVVDGNPLDIRSRSWREAYNALHAIAKEKAFALAVVYYDGWSRAYSAQSGKVKLLPDWRP